MVARCNKVLDLPFGHSKAHFRRAKAYTQLGRLQVPPPLARCNSLSVAGRSGPPCEEEQTLVRRDARG